MPKIVFIEHNGKEHVVDATVGKSIMQTALDHSVPGILGDCGGECSCGTCHCYVADPAWQQRLPPIAENEEVMLEGTLHTEANSRLGCQLKVTEEFDGLVLRLPHSQVL
ncbi:2Fe-2S iron-sulfur cluster-binding protein [Solimonas terrae]|uniref:2Fe-2S iron-sulfur cluster binding domain-containing protein n=1 Tax=Solimonas terrae TaxID=1396819 RepID=A0A6M2BPG4_9GAMM|nr:2Fe-2S iron-sulfur cluster-binding protein [Solimonas terrae]NGY03957.1 2Fe-2S iron-sulfur cluster binding domain-containing protein [Solimonas terrae]